MHVSRVAFEALYQTLALATMLVKRHHETSYYKEAKHELTFHENRVLFHKQQEGVYEKDTLWRVD